MITANERKFAYEFIFFFIVSVKGLYVGNQPRNSIQRIEINLLIFNEIYVKSSIRYVSFTIHIVGF